MVNKTKIAKKLSQRMLLTTKEAEQAIEELFDILLEEVIKFDEVNIAGFGKFYTYEHHPRPVRNPKTQEEMTLESYKSLKFKPSGKIKSVLKKKTKK